MKKNAKEFGPMSDHIIPVPIRAGMTVYVQGLPLDLTKDEAEKISRVVKAMAAFSPLDELAGDHDDR